LARFDLHSFPTRRSSDLARETANNNLLDGVDNNDPAINSFTLRPILDDIQEFKVLANSYSAEYGRSGGAQVIVNTKSGTNDIHADRKSTRLNSSHVAISY